ncbi:TonB-dependent receptor domain-containing protein [Pseudoalteromonas sp.]|uniref:TonB-dependent receptor domain-containing protein n=1 Tax=Pseudoalteromonas sp. TaxID=53249 RepID=UPI00356A5816
MKSHFLGYQISFKKAFLPLTISSLLIGAPAINAAEEEAAAQVERIEVTGSRIKRVDMEGAVPVTVLNAVDLEAQGFATVGDALRNSNLNSFGSYGGGANNSWSSQSTVALKGASIQHTLTLLDGKRMAKSPVLDGGASNLNTIPMAAVERIEILTDGASAIYGTDAIAGVINVILKKDFQGVQFDARTEQHDREGGDSNKFSFTGGLSSDKGNLVFTIEHFQQDNIMFSERDYTQPFVQPGGDSSDANDWQNISWTGRVLTQGGAGGWAWEHPFANDVSCSEVYGEAFIGPLNDRNYAGDSICGYDYTRAAAATSKATRDNTLIHYTYELSDSIELTARAYWAQNKYLDISAPVPASISIPQGLPAYTTPEGIELKELYADPWAGMRYRFDTAGDRVAEKHDSVLDFLFALEGTTEHFDWDVSANYNKYNAFTWGTGYLLDGAQNDLIGYYDEQAGEFIGWDPRDPNSPLPAGAKANYDKRGAAEYLELTGGASFSVMELPAGEIGAYVGASYREEEYDHQVDALAEAGLIVGGSGGSGGAGKRDVMSAYFEIVVPVLDELELNLAGRYDDYSDFGSTTNPQVSVSYRPLDSLLLRASWGTGFRAPTLSDLNKGMVEGYGDITNYVACYEEGEDIDSCNRIEEAPTRTGGNLNLGPEESESTNFGVSYNITENIDITVDYWTLTTEGLISSISSDEIMQTQAKLYQIADDLGVERPDISLIYPGSEISLLANGRIDYVVAPRINLGESDREGLDISFNAGFEIGEGQLDLGLNISKYLKYTYTYVDNGEAVVAEDVSGREGYPDLRLNMTMSYQLGDHSVSYWSNWMSEQKSWDLVEGSETELFVVDEYTTHNLSYTMHLPWSNSFTLGVNNITDEDPSFDRWGGYDGDLYSIYGRSYYLSFRQQF